MILSAELREQLQQYLALLEKDVLLRTSLGDNEASKQMSEFVHEVSSLSDKIHIEFKPLERTPSFALFLDQTDTGIHFAGIPLGHEFTSFVLALLQVGGRAPKISEAQKVQIQSINKSYHFESFISLSCHNCPDVVQSLNIMSVLNPRISHTMIDGALFQEEVHRKDIMAVPSVYLNGDFFESGRMTLDDILQNLGYYQSESFDEPYDVLVIGGGPAGSAASIYSARKGIRTGMIAKRLGGQVQDTLGIENMISIPYTEGPKLAKNLEEHIRSYEVDLITGKNVIQLEKKDLFEIELENGSTLKSKTVILATGARWRNINVPGEIEFKNKGVAYCPHCDGPLFKGKSIAVIGGGNSGIEAAIDLANLAKHVTVLEFLPELKADLVLQRRLNQLSNVSVLTNVSTEEILGDSKVSALRYKNRLTDESTTLSVEGVFILVGLVPNTEWLQETLTLNSRGEIPVDRHGATNVPGIFAAGDCTDSAYKQIVISMGSGATAALGAFDYLIRLPE
ncbi:MAG: alkyl hydroperoxide reductase subunit F [Vallitaleaceae bacterium]|nr:alkyl hydroperoxide reductase subunit F [Vallitaleaceae bacterium]